MYKKWLKKSQPQNGARSTTIENFLRGEPFGTHIAEHELGRKNHKR